MTKYNNQSDLTFFTNSRKDDYTRAENLSHLRILLTTDQKKKNKYHNAIKLFQHRNKKTCNLKIILGKEIRKYFVTMETS